MFGSISEHASVVSKLYGFDVDIFTDGQAAKKLTCYLCRSVCRDPRQTSCCGNLVCQSCLSAFLDKSTLVNTYRCFANCLQEFSTFPDARAQREIGLLTVRCPVCSWNGKVADLEHHQCNKSARPHHYQPKISKGTQLELVEEALSQPQYISETAAKHHIPRRTLQQWVDTARAEGTLFLRDAAFKVATCFRKKRNCSYPPPGPKPHVSHQDTVELAKQICDRRSEFRSTSSRWFRRQAGFKRTLRVREALVEANKQDC